MITHETRLCDHTKDLCIGFGGKNARFGEWIILEMNIVAPQHVKEGMKRSVCVDFGKKVGESAGLDSHFHLKATIPL